MRKESLTILVDQARAFLDRQWDAFESQDKKIAGLFGLATGLITLVPAIVTAFGPNELGFRVVPFALSALAYFGVTLLPWKAYRPGDISLIGNASAYYERWLELDEVDMLRLTLLDLSRAQIENQQALEMKKARLDRAAVAAAVQVALLVAGILSAAV